MTELDQKTGLVVITEDALPPIQSYDPQTGRKRLLVNLPPRQQGKNLWLAQEVQRMMALDPSLKVALYTREGYCGDIVAVNLPAPLAAPEIKKS